MCLCVYTVLKTEPEIGTSDILGKNSTIESYHQFFFFKSTFYFETEFTSVVQAGLELAILLNPSLKELGLQA